VIKITTYKDGECISFDLDWNGIISTKKGIYEPAFKAEKLENGNNAGTEIEITNLKRKSGFDLQSLADSVSKLFNFYDDDFKVTLYFNDKNPVIIDRKRKYQNIGEEFTWGIPKDFQIGKEKDGIKGTIYASEKPLKPDLRGITLYARGRMVNSPEFFGVGESSHAYSYLTGWIDVDYIDGGDEDLISTQRTSLRWEEPEAEELRIQLQELLKKVEKDWRKKRKESRVREITRDSNLNIENWVESQSTKTGKQLDFLIKLLMEEPAIPREVGKSTLEAIHKIIPEYADFHWRHLHPQIKDVAFLPYHKREYYEAVSEAIKRYETQVRRKTNSSLDGQSLMQSAFSPENEKDAKGTTYKLSIMKNKRKSDQSPFSEKTIQNIEDGQRYLSVGVIAGVRNPLAHEEIKELQASGVFSEKDCLDSLSLLSMLFTKLDGAERR
jgi:TIGR02391 family protein